MGEQATWIVVVNGAILGLYALIRHGIDRRHDSRLQQLTIDNAQCHKDHAEARVQIAGLEDKIGALNGHVEQCQADHAEARVQIAELKARMGVDR